MTRTGISPSGATLAELVVVLDGAANVKLICRYERDTRFALGGAVLLPLDHPSVCSYLPDGWGDFVKHCRSEHLIEFPFIQKPEARYYLDLRLSGP